MYGNNGTDHHYCRNNDFRLQMPWPLSLHDDVMHTLGETTEKKLLAYSCARWFWFFQAIKRRLFDPQSDVVWNKRRQVENDYWGWPSYLMGMWASISLPNYFHRYGSIVRINHDKIVTDWSLFTILMYVSLERTLCMMSF